MENIALCKCGVDMADHYVDDLEDSPFDHPFTAAGTKYRCGEELLNGYLCAMPRYHEDDSVPHGPIKFHLPQGV